MIGTLATHSTSAAFGDGVLMTTVYGSGDGDLERLAAHDQEILRRRMQRLVVDDLKTEEDVFRRDRMPV